MSEYWWLAPQPGRDRGPFTAAELAGLRDAGKLAPGERAWSSATRRWMPATGQHDEIAPPPPTRASGLRTAGLWSLGVVYLAALSACVTLIATRLALRLDAEVAAVGWPALGLAMLAASLGVIAAWVRPGRLGATRPELAALRSVGAGFLGLAGVVAGGLILYQTHDIIATLRAVRELTYEIHPNQTGTAVEVHGFIGVGFADALSQALSRPGAPSQVEITSLGGLTEEALAAARTIEAHNDTVAVRRICASACLAVLLAGRERLADLDARLDFHATAPIAPALSPAVRWAERNAGVDFRAFLARRGAPSDVLDTADRVGPDQVESLSALEALDLKLLTGVQRNGELLEHRTVALALARSPRRLVRSAVYLEPGL